MGKRSCLTNLLEFLLVYITTQIDEGNRVDVIYLDFQKAFDKVPRARLICKLKAHGISGKILTWIENWLLNRKQRVVVNGKLSWLIDVLSGVPQESILGPFTHSLTAALDQLRVVASSTSNDPGPRSRQHQQIGQCLLPLAAANFF